MLSIIIGLVSLFGWTTTASAVEPPEPIPLTVQELIAREAGKLGVDSSLAVNIAKCESELKQFENGQVLRGKQNPQDVGVFQINEKYHLETSRKLGYDIYSTEGNIQYAIRLMKREGVHHWNWSKWCWLDKKTRQE